MTVRELIDKLENYDDNIEVVLQSCNNSFVDKIKEIDEREIIRWDFSNKYIPQDVLILLSGGQIATTYDIEDDSIII